MTDHTNALVVVLEHDIRTDDVESLMQAIRHLRGVLSVTPNVSNVDSHIAQQRAFYDIRERMQRAFALEGEL